MTQTAPAAPTLEDVQNDEEVLAYLEAISGLHFVRPGDQHLLPDMPLDLALTDQPLRHVLLALADAAGITFVVRDYGLLAVRRDLARQYEGSTTIPPAPRRRR